MKEEKILAKWDDWSWNFITSERFLETLAEDLAKPAGHQHHHKGGHGH